MRRLVFALCLALVGATSMFGISAAAPKPTILTPSELTWTAVPGLPGAQQAVVYGDPTAAGSTYTLRLKLADGTKIPPHWHPSDERVTVLSGTFLVGLGDTMDTAAMKELPAGSFCFVPAKLHHYAMAKGETIVQTTGTGPFQMNPVK